MKRLLSTSQFSRKINRVGDAFIPTQSGNRTYREELYAGRRIILQSGPNAGSGNGRIGRMYDLLKSEGIFAKIRSKREFMRPGEKAGHEWAARRKIRFNQMVAKTVNEIKDIYRRLA